MMINRFVWLKILILSIVLFLFVVSSYVILHEQPSVSYDMFRLAIYPTSTGSSSYLFSLDPDGLLIVEEGTRFTDEITDFPFIRINKQSKKIFLQKQMINDIYNLVIEAYNCENIKPYIVANGGWNVQMIYKGRIIKQYYGADYSCTTPEIMNIANKLIEISPIDIDLRNG